MIPLPNEQQELYEKTKICYIFFFKFKHKYANDKNYCEVKDHCHYTGKYRAAAHSICNLKYSIFKSIALVFHNGSSYDYNFVINELAKEFKEELNCLGENTDT